MFGLVIQKYFIAPTLLLYKVGSSNEVQTKADKLFVVHIGEDTGLVATMFVWRIMSSI